MGISARNTHIINRKLGIIQLIAGGAVAFIGITLVPLLSSLF